MAEVGAMLTSAVLKMVGKQVGSTISGQIKLQWDFTDDLKDMKMTLESVEAFLKDAERRSVTEKSVRLWLRRLKNAMYDISDMINGFEADTTHNKSKIFSNLSISAKKKTAKDMRRMRGELKKITKQHRDFSFASENSSNIQKEDSSDRKTSPKVEETAIVGRIQEKREILACLSKKILTQDFIILAIYGMGGIGKTTLAQLVFNDKQFKEYFPAWVHVSQVFDLDKIETSLITQLSKRAPNMIDLDIVPPNLNIIIVLDDLWENDGFKLDNLKLKLKIGNGAKVIILVTTRDKSIATRFSNVEPYKLEPLTNDMCWKIIKQKSAFEGRYDREWLEHIGKDIARKCGGVALAAQSLGYILHSKRADEWESVRDSNIWNESTSEDTSSPHHMLASLKLSYLRMKPCLKMCFGYCAIFPKGQRIVKDDLIHQWICLDFIETSKIYSSKQLGEIYVDELLGMSFLQHSKWFAGVHQENVTLFTMHDLVHDLASSVMVDEILVSSKQDNNGERYALLSDSTKPLHSFTKFPAKLRALCFVDCAKTELHYDAFSGAKYLRVLDLSQCFVQKLPDSISQLRQLRYLSAPGIQDTMIPDCITKLSKLVYLNLHGSARLRSLPVSIGEMDSLMHLDLSGCSGIRRVPQSFGKLKLSYLDLSNCSSLKDVSEFLGNLTKLQYLNLSYCQYVEKLGYLGSLTELRYFLFSSSCSPGLSQTDVLGPSTKLEYLNLSTEFTDIKIKRLPEAMGCFIKLKYLNLSGWQKLKELPRSWGNLQNLMHLDLSECRMINGVPEALRCLDTLIYEEVEADVVCQNFLAYVCSLSNLEELDLSYNECITTLPESIGDLRKLHTLILRGCYHLSQLPKVLLKNDNLKQLNISGCHNLDKSTVPESDSSLILLPQFAVQALDGGSGSNLVLLQNVNSATYLDISKLENVVTVEEAQSVRLKEKKMISTLTLEWTTDARRFVEDQDLLGELEPPRDLEWFGLEGYNSVAFPPWLMNIAPHHFSKLSRIDLVGLPKCTYLPPLGQLPLLNYLFLAEMNGITKIDGEFCGGAGAFPSLKDLYIFNMESLEEWQTKYSCSEGGGVSEFMFPTLTTLEIRYCPKLRLKPCPSNKSICLEIEGSDNVISSWPVGTCASTSSSVSVQRMAVKSCKLPLHQWRMLHQLASHSNLTIESCSDIGSCSPEIAQALSPLKELTLGGNDDMLELPKWMGELTCLTCLKISTRCPELKASQGVTRRLTSLTSLTLHKCECMVSLPEWLGDLPSLRFLSIRECPNLNNLQGIMDERLTSLKTLSLEYCESISVLPESLGELTSLNQLDITCCTNIKSLPESIHKLAKLFRLIVRKCPELKKWCESEENKTKFSNVLSKRVYSYH
uniref:Uncharacterized protein n=1 Tax=Oryza nivara TaxID=4536 RepID=A0A0E0IZJ3_ORYNI